MIWKAAKMLPAWLNELVVSYDDFRKESKKYRCKIVDINTNEHTNETSLLVMVSGIKPQIIPYLPKELVVNDSMLNEFSSFDVRAITFYSLLKENNLLKLHQSKSIVGQEISGGETIFIVNKLTENEEDRYSAHELYCDPNLFDDFTDNDIKNIISPAIQEQPIKDFQRVYE